jgi:hypothetical protein
LVKKRSLSAQFFHQNDKFLIVFDKKGSKTPVFKAVFDRKKPVFGLLSAI